MSPDNEHIMNRMAREVRKFGVGLILVSQNFDHFPEDLIANSAMTMILGLHDMHHDRAARRLGLKRENLKWIKPKQTALVQVRSGSNAGLTNTFKEVILRSEEHTSELQSLMRISYAVFCFKKQNSPKKHTD